MEKIIDSCDKQYQLKLIFKDMLKYSPSKICGMIGNAIIIPVYTNLLLPNEYGIYTLSVALLSFFCILCSDWVGLSGLRFFRKFENENNLTKYISVLILILAFNITILYLSTCFFKEYIFSFFKLSSIYCYAVLLLLIPVAIRALLFQILRAQIKPIAFTLSTILNQILTICFSIILIKFYKLGAMSILLSMGISISIVDIILIFQSKIYKYIRPPQLNKSILIPIFIYGIPISATSFSNWLINQSNKFIMNNIKGFTDVGYVGVAYGITFPILLTLFSIIVVAAIPRIIRLYEDKVEVNFYISKFLGYYILASLPIITLISLYSTEYLGILSNTKYYEAYKIIPFFAFGAFFMGITEYTTIQYHLVNKTYIDFIIKLISGILGVILNIILIPKVGLTGIGISVLIANFTYFILSVVIVIPSLQFKIPTKLYLDMSIGFIFMFLANKIILSQLDINILLHFTILLILYYSFYIFSQNYLFKNLKHSD